MGDTEEGSPAPAREEGGEEKEEEETPVSVDFTRQVEVNIPSAANAKLAKELVVKALQDVSNLGPDNFLCDTVMDGNRAIQKVALQDPSLWDPLLSTLEKCIPRPSGKAGEVRFKEIGCLGTPLNLPHVAWLLGALQGTLYLLRVFDASKKGTAGHVVRVGDSSQSLNHLLKRLKGGYHLLVANPVHAAWLSQYQLDLLHGPPGEPRQFAQEDLAEEAYTRFIADLPVLARHLSPAQLRAYMDETGARAGIPEIPEHVPPPWRAPFSGDDPWRPAVPGVPETDREFIWGEWAKEPTDTYERYSGHITAIARALCGRRASATPPVPVEGATPAEQEENVAWEVADYVRAAGCMPRQPASLLQRVWENSLVPHKTSTMNVRERDAQLAVEFGNKIYDVFKLAGFHGLFLPPNAEVDKTIAEEGVLEDEGKPEYPSFLVRNPHIYIASPYFEIPGREAKNEPATPASQRKYKQVLDHRVNAILDLLRKSAPFQKSSEDLKLKNHSAVDLWASILKVREESAGKGGAPKKGGKGKATASNPWAWVGKQTVKQVKKGRPYFSWQADRYILNSIGGRQQFTRDIFFKKTMPAPDNPVSHYCLFLEIQYLLSIYFTFNVPAPEDLHINAVIDKAVEVLICTHDPKITGRVGEIVRNVLQQKQFQPELEPNEAAAEDKGVVEEEAGMYKLKGGSLEKRIRATLHLALWTEFLAEFYSWLVRPKRVKQGNFSKFLGVLAKDDTIYEAASANMLLKVKLAQFYRSTGIPVPPEVVDWVPDRWMSRGPNNLPVPSRASFGDLAEMLAIQAGGKTRLGGGNCIARVDPFDKSLADVLVELKHIAFVGGRFAKTSKPVDETTVPDADAMVLLDPRTGEKHRFHKDVWFAFKRFLKYRFGNMVYNRAIIISLLAMRKEEAKATGKEEEQEGDFIPAVLKSAGASHARRVGMARDKFRVIDRAILAELTKDFPALCEFAFRGSVAPKVVALVLKKVDLPDIDSRMVRSRVLGLRNAFDRFDEPNKPFTILGGALNRAVVRTRLRDLDRAFQAKFARTKDPQDKKRLRTFEYIKQQGLIAHLHNICNFGDLLFDSSKPDDPYILTPFEVPYASFIGDYRELYRSVNLVDEKWIRADEKISGEPSLLTPLEELMAVCPRPIGPVRGPMSTAFPGKLLDCKQDQLAYYKRLIEAILKGLVIQHEGELEAYRVGAKLKPGTADDKISKSLRKHVGKLLQLAYACEFLKGGSNFVVLLNTPVLLPARGFVASFSGALGRVVHLKDVEEFFTKDLVAINGDKSLSFSGVSLRSLEAPLEDVHKDYFKKAHAHYYAEVGKLIYILALVHAVLGGEIKDDDKDKALRAYLDAFITEVLGSPDTEGAWRRRVEARLNKKGVSNTRAVSDLTYSPEPFKTLLGILVDKLGLTAGSIAKFDLTYDMEFKPVPCEQSDFKPVLGPMDLLPAISRAIASRDTDVIPFTVKGRPLDVESIKKYDNLFQGTRAGLGNPLRAEAAISIAKPLEQAVYDKRAKRRLDYETQSGSLAPKMAEVLASIGESLKEMHTERDKMRPLKGAYKRLDLWENRQDCITQVMLKLNDQVYRGLREKTSAFTSAFTHRFGELIEDLTGKRLPRIEHSEAGLVAFCQKVEGIATKASYPYLDTGPMAGFYSAGDKGKLVEDGVIWTPPPEEAEQTQETIMGALSDVAGSIIGAGKPSEGEKAEPKSEPEVTTVEDVITRLAKYVLGELIPQPEPEAPETESPVEPGLGTTTPGGIIEDLAGGIIGGIADDLIEGIAGGEDEPGREIITIEDVIERLREEIDNTEEGNTKQDLQARADFYVTCLVLVQVLKSPRMSKDVRNENRVKKIRSEERARIRKIVSLLHDARTRNAETALRIEVGRVDPQITRDTLENYSREDLLNVAYWRSKYSDTRIRDLAKIKNESRAKFIRLQRMERRRFTQVIGRGNDHRIMRERRVLALEFLQSKEKGDWNCPKFHEKLVVGGKEVSREDGRPPDFEAFPLPGVVCLTGTLLRRMREGNTSGTQRGASIGGLKVLPPDDASGHVVMSVFLRHIPDGDDAVLEPWFEALLGVVIPKTVPKGSARAVDVNQFNCGRPYAHGILGSGPDFRPFPLEGRYTPIPEGSTTQPPIDPEHVTALEASILLNLYRFSPVQQLEGDVESEEGEGATTGTLDVGDRPRVAMLNEYKGNEAGDTGGPCYSLARVGTGDDRVKRVVPAFSFLWKVRQTLVDKRLFSAGRPPDVPSDWDPEKTFFSCGEADTLLCMPAAQFPYNDLPYFDPGLVSELDAEVSKHLQHDPRVPSFNDEINFPPFYFAGKWSHISHHIAAVQTILGRVAKIKPGAMLTDRQVRGWYRLAVSKKKRARKLWNEFRFLGNRQTAIRAEGLRYLSKCDAYLSLRFPTTYVAYENLAFSAAGLTGVLGKAVQGMPKDYNDVVAQTTKSFKRGGNCFPAANLALPEYQSVPAPKTSQRCGMHLGDTAGTPAGEIDNKSSANWGVDDEYGEIVDRHVNSTYNMARSLFATIAEKKVKGEKAASKEADKQAKRTRKEEEKIARQAQKAAEDSLKTLKSYFS